MGFFEQIFGTELGLPARAVVALVLVLALIALTVWLMRRFGEGRIATPAGGRGRQQRLAVLDSAVVDARRRLVLIRRDNVEHLILIGGPTDVVVEPNIVRAQPLAGTARPAARPGGYEPGEEAEATLIPEPGAGEPERAAPAPQRPGEPARPAPRPAPQRVEPQYSDMAKRLEAALRKPVAEPEVSRPAPPPMARAPEPRMAPPRPAPAPAPAPAPRAPEPRIPEPRTTETPRAPEPRAAEPRPQPAPPAQPAQPAKAEPQTAADIFGSLEEEMASLLRPGAKKDNK